jgi:hypothetical protein
MTIAFGLAGSVVGWVYFALMRYSLSHLSRESTAIMKFAALALLRVVLFCAGGLVCALMVGTWCLVAYLLGFVVARTIAVGRARTAGGLSTPAPENRKNNG